MPGDLYQINVVVNPADEEVIDVLVSDLGYSDTQAELLLKQTLIKTVGTLGSSGTLNLDMTAMSGTLQTTPALTGALTFTTSNRGSGKHVDVRIVNGATLRAFTWPSWVWVGGAAPASIAANKSGLLSVRFFGSEDTDAIASWLVQS